MFVSFRSFSVFLYIVCIGLMTSAAIAQQAVTQTSQHNSVIPSSISTPLTDEQDKQSFAASRTYAVPLGSKQKPQNRVIALYNIKALTREGWIDWNEAPQPIQDFLALRSKNMATAARAQTGVSFRVFDMDGDNKNDLIVRFGSYTACAMTATGCAHAVFYADTTKPYVMFYARKFLPAVGGVLLNNNFFALMPQGGEIFNNVSTLMYDPSSPFDTEKLMLTEYVQKLFPDYFKMTHGAPGFRYVKYDLDLDGRPEYIVMIADDGGDFGLCDKGDVSMCPVLVYTSNKSPDDLHLIAQFKALPQFTFARTAKPGYADIITAINDVMKSRTVAYFMNSNSGLYELEK